MVSPYLTKKKDDSFSLEHSIRKLFQVIYKELNKEEKVNEDEPKINVSELISKMAFYYEKIRNAVEYSEEHLHRKDAIVRILKRLIVIEGIIKISKSDELASNLLVELIRAGYLPNNKIPESKIDEVSRIVEKHIRLRNKVLPHIKGIGDISKQVEKMIIKEKREMGEWLIGLIASEIESVLEVDRVKEIVVSNMYEYLADNIKLPINFQEYEKDLKLQIYLSIHRSYVKFDRDMLSFIVFKYYNSEWWLPKEEDISRIAANINSLKNAVNAQLDHPLARQLDKHIGRYATYYNVLVDTIGGEPTKVYEKIKTKPEAFPGMIRDVFNKRYESARSKLWRAGINSIVYITIAKALFFGGKYFFSAFSNPENIKYVGGEINPLFLLVDMGTPAVLLFLVMFFTSISPEANNKKVIEGVLEITFSEKKRTEPIVLRKPIKRGSLIGAFFSFFYTITYFISFGTIVWILMKMNFNYINILSFLFFLTFVSFLSLRIRRNIQQLMVIDEKDNLITFIIDFFFVPIIRVGKWMSAKFSRLNVFVFILDFIIEAPFKVFVEIADQWTKYVKERKEDIV